MFVIHRLKPHLRAVCTALLLLGGLAGCAEAVDPFIDADRYFTVYGYLDTAGDTQYVRVIPLRRSIGASDEGIDAIVSSTAVETGERVVWRDSLVELSDGSFGHVFYAPFRPIPEWTYRLEIERGDGATTSAETTIPPATRVEVLNPTTMGAMVDQRVQWEDIDFPPFRVEVWYRFANLRPDQSFVEAVVTYENVGQINSESEWEVLVLLSRDRSRVTQLLGVSEDAALTLLGVGMRLAVSDERWRPPGGVFDRETLVQPGTFSNVENGFGFFGGVNQYAVEWALPRATVERLGYRFPGKAERER